MAKISDLICLGNSNVYVDSHYSDSTLHDKHRPLFDAQEPFLPQRKKNHQVQPDSNNHTRLFHFVCCKILVFWQFNLFTVVLSLSFLANFYPRYSCDCKAMPQGHF